MSIIKAMTWNEFVSEYKPIEFNDDTKILGFDDYFMRLGGMTGVDLIEPSLVIRKYIAGVYAASRFPRNHVSVILQFYNPRLNCLYARDSQVYWFVTRKPLNDDVIHASFPDIELRIKSIGD